MGKIVRIKRVINAGENNPNCDKPYLNMDEKLEKLFKDRNNNVMVQGFVSDEELSNPLIMSWIPADNLFGYALSYNENSFEIELTEFGESIVETYGLDKLSIQIITLVRNTDDDSLCIIKIIKLALSKLEED